eukprot:c4494_g1_i1 orf=266-451(+)
MPFVGIYLSGISDYGIFYGQGSTLTGRIDSDWVGDIDACHSTIGCVFSLKSVSIAWSSKKQ